MNYKPCKDCKVLDAFLWIPASAFQKNSLQNPCCPSPAPAILWTCRLAPTVALGSKSLKLIVRLSESFRVSAKALGLRAVDLGLMDADSNAYGLRQCSLF